MTPSLIPISKELAHASFDCGVPALDDYYRHYALKNDRLGIGKTFVAVDEGSRVLGYVTLSSAQVEAEKLPEDLRAKLPRYPAPAFRIGKLAVAKASQGQGVGRWLLAHAFNKALDVARHLGLCAIIVDAIDANAARFYLKYGFVPFEAQALALFLPLETIRRARDVEMEDQPKH